MQLIRPVMSILLHCDFFPVTRIISPDGRDPDNALKRGIDQQGNRNPETSAQKTDRIKTEEILIDAVPVNLECRTQRQLLSSDKEEVRQQ